MITSTECTDCREQFPATAEFCPFCGAERHGSDHARARIPFNRTLVQALVREATGNETVLVEPIDDRFVRFRQYGLRAVAAVALLATVAGGIGVGSWLANEIDEHRGAAAQATTPPSNQGAATIAPQVWVARLSDSFELVRGAEVIHAVETVDGSRYETIQERGEAVQLRLDHVSKKSNGHFVARVAGENHEVVWTDGKRDFRIMDVTPADAAKLDSEPDIVANLLADRLNADLRRPNS